ncbi:MAG: hypothetical protein IPH62_00255 [Ignavibacteriae bacterium]|nr:hypothetical protein [Ignavibacteriota bacterium]MBK7103704.1 hypothetical protein [Ignavibacteriota bacterium]
MSNEEVLFNSDTHKVTVTNKRLIYGEEVTNIESIKHASWSNSDGAKEYFLAVVFGVIGLWLVTTFSLWSILGLLLLSNPILVFFVKNKYWVFIFLKSGSTIDEGTDNKRMFPKEIAISVSEAVNLAVSRYRVENDPRKGLNL